MKLLLWIVIAAAVLVAAFYALNSYIYNEKQGDASVFLKDTSGAPPQS